MEAKSIFLGLLLIVASVFAVPTVSFVAPTPSSGDVINYVPVINATANSALNVDSVAIYWNGNLLKECSTSATSVVCTFDPSVDDASNATYSTSAEVNFILLTAIAKDADGEATATQTIKIDAKPPSVSINTPSSGYVSGTVSISVEAKEGASGLDSFEVVAGSYSQTDNGPFYYGKATRQFSWDTSAEQDGQHTITARVMDGVGNVGVATVDVVVNNTAPMEINVGFRGDTPADGAAVTGDFTVEANASATVNVDNITIYVDGVEYQNCPGDVCIVRVNTSSYNAGDNISFYAVAYAGGVSNTTETRTVIFNPPSISVNITAPADGATVQGVEPITVEASATAGLQVVRIYIDGAVEAENSSFSSPWTYQWNTSSESNGVHRIVAEAVDTNGVAVNSTEVSVNVNNPNPGVNLSISFVDPTPADNTAIDPSNTSTIINASVTTNLTVDTIIIYMDGNPVANGSGVDYLEYDWNVSNYGNGSYAFYATVNTTTGETASTSTITLNVGQANNNGGNNNNGGGSGGGGGGGSSKKTKDEPLSLSYTYVCPDSKLKVVAESNGDAVAGVMLYLQKAGATFSYVEKTDDEGMAYFNIREAAQYSLNGSKEGYKLAERSVNIRELCQQEEQKEQPEQQAELANETVEANETAAPANETSALEEVTSEESNNATGKLAPTAEPEPQEPLAEQQDQKGLVETLTENPVLTFFGIVAIPFVLIGISRIIVAVLKRL